MDRVAAGFTAAGRLERTRDVNDTCGLPLLAIFFLLTCGFAFLLW